jgi:hypothetical protein
MSILGAHSAHAGVDGTVAVLNLLGRFESGAESAVDCEIGLCSDQLAKGHELMKADVIRFNSVGPHRLEARRTLIAIAEAIAVVVGRNKVPSGPLEHLEPCLFEEPNHSRVNPTPDFPFMSI